MQIEFVVILKILIFSYEYSIGATNWFRLIYHMILFFFSLDFLVGEGWGCLGTVLHSFHSFSTIMIGISSYSRKQL